jgi:hypothetical protein
LTIEQRYRDRKKQWQNGRSYTASDLTHLEAAAREARTRIENWRKERTAQQAAAR